jgi:hypothetical protein
MRKGAGVDEKAEDGDVRYSVFDRSLFGVIDDDDFEWAFLCG